MTEESRQMQLTNPNQIWFLLFLVHRMNAFTFFVQNSSLVNSLVDKHERTVDYTTIQLYYVRMIKYVQYLIINWNITLHLENFYRINKLSVTRDEADEPQRNWRIIVLQSKCKTELTDHVVVCIFRWQDIQCSDFSMSIYWKNFVDTNFAMLGGRRQMISKSRNL